MFSYFYHGSTRKYVIAFGSLFDDISVVRTATDGTEVQRIKVPIAYGPKEKFLVRLAQDPTLTNPLGIVLPRIGFEVTNITYDATRKLNRMNRRWTPIVGNTREATRQFSEWPCTIAFGLHVMTRNTEDGLQILEQILPYYTPDYTITINTISDLGIQADVPIIYEGLTWEDMYEGDMQTRRALTWTLNFNMKAVLYGPVKQKKIITDATIDTYTVNRDTNLVPASHYQTEQGDRLVMEDDSGLILLETDDSVSDATRVSRTHVTPDPEGAQLGDTFGFSVSYEDFVDGKQYNRITDADEDLD